MADALALPSTVEELEALLKFNYENKIETNVIGKGTNLLVSDKGIRGCVIVLADNFDDDQHKSMLFIGKTGLGKTYLALSIAQRLIAKNKSVVYETSLQLFEKLARTVFNRTEEITDRGFYDLVYEADLLIIDDLGTEIVNDYVNSQLFNIVNTRILANKKIIISTNLTAVEINDRYERRITSRLFDRNDFVHYKFIGTDLRWRK